MKEAAAGNRGGFLLFGFWQRHRPACDTRTMSLILSKLILPSVLILLPSLAARRWGHAIGGWLVGLPMTTGPVVAFLAIQYGPEFAVRAAGGSIIGAAGQAAFSIGYALAVRQGWIPAFSPERRRLPALPLCFSRCLCRIGPCSSWR